MVFQAQELQRMIKQSSDAGKQAAFLCRHTLKVRALCKPCKIFFCGGTEVPSISATQFVDSVFHFLRSFRKNAVKKSIHHVMALSP